MASFKPEWREECVWDTDIKKVLVEEKAIQERCKELAKQISDEYKKDGVEQLLVVGVLKGAFMFVSDLARHLSIPHAIDFMSVSSYGKSVSAGEVRVVMDMREPVGGKHVLLVEDIVDSGQTLQFLAKLIGARNPASLKIASLAKKERDTPCPTHVDYLGFTLPDVWLVGYGLDYAEKHRTHPFIGELKEEVYAPKS